MEKSEKNRNEDRDGNFIELEDTMFVISEIGPFASHVRPIKGAESGSNVWEYVDT